MSTLTTPSSCPYTPIMFRIIHRLARSVIVLLILITIILAASSVWFLVGVYSNSRNLDPQVAFWMEHSWVNGTQNDFSVLAECVKNYGITDLYFHVGPIQEGGELADDLNFFKAGFETLGTTNYAWIGQVRSKIDIDNEGVRTGIVNSSRWLIDQGFDGIHLDIEPVREDDTAFILLVAQMRQALPNAKISVAMDEWQPHIFSQLIAKFLDMPIESYWSTSQIKQVAELVDQIVVMTYDSNLKNSKDYIWWVEQQTIALSDRVPKDTELFIGIPSYEEGESIDPTVENIQTGLAGFERGYKNLRSDYGKITGIAIYSYWEMSDDEWAALKNLQD